LEAFYYDEGDAMKSEVSRPRASQPKRKPQSRHPDFPTSDLTPIAEATAAFFSKMSDEDRDQYGGDEESQLAGYEKFLRESTRLTFGVVNAAQAARLTGVNPDTMRIASGIHRERHFPKAIIYERDPVTGLELEGRKWICIFHKDFVSWVRDKYHPRHRPHTSECKLNTLFRDSRGEWLPQEKWPSFTFKVVDEATGQAQPITEQLEPCPNQPARSRSKFCNTKTHGVAHHIIYRTLSGDYLRVGLMGLTSRKGGPRRRALASTIEARKASLPRGKDKPKRRQSAPRVVYLPDGWFK
jgi:hypothetical protein